MTTKTESRRYYYTSQKSFEQSLDVDKPVVEQESSADLPLVVLVVGSAWLGHRSIIYTGTSWWNSSGPKAFAKQGCVTVCIRHRGSFPRIAHYGGPLVFPMMLTTALMVLVAAMMMNMFPNIMHGDNGTTILVSMASSVSSIVAMLIVACSSWALLALGARGAADFDTMLHDVADALCWVQRHKETHILQKSSSSIHSFTTMEEKKDGENYSQQQTTTVVFGGYSSGGHVAATLMQRPDLFSQKGLPAPDEFCDAALFISGVLAVRPPVTTTSRTTTTTDDTTTTQHISSTWCTDLVTNVVFGTAGASKLPSPLHGVHKQPQVPHLLIGCEHEVFGLGWMDVFFCSSAFCDSLRKRKVPAKFVQVQSDHWNILGSTSLSDALNTELEWIMNKALEK